MYYLGLAPSVQVHLEDQLVWSSLLPGRPSTLHAPHGRRGKNHCTNPHAVASRAAYLYPDSWYLAA